MRSEGRCFCVTLSAGAIADKRTLIVATGGVLTIESCRQAWVSSIANKGTPWSRATDAPLSINDSVHTLTNAFGFVASYRLQCQLPSRSQEVPWTDHRHKGSRSWQTHQAQLRCPGCRPPHYLHWLGRPFTTGSTTRTNYAVVTIAYDPSAATNDTVIAGLPSFPSGSPATLGRFRSFFTTIWFSGTLHVWFIHTNAWFVRDMCRITGF